MRIDRQSADEWFPVYLRYLGSVLSIILIVATIFGQAGLNFAPAYVAVAGMIGYKSIHDFGRKPKGES